MAIRGALTLSFAMMDGNLSQDELKDMMVDTTMFLASSLIPGGGYIMMAYNLYNMVSSLGDNECTPFEDMLACKVGEGLCHEIGDKCTQKVFGWCLQKKKIYCCFNTKLARIIHEQGRPQVGWGWGDPETPMCGGFTLDQFARIDFSEMDLSEYINDVTRRSSIDMTDSVNKSIERWSDSLGQ